MEKIYEMLENKEVKCDICNRIKEYDSTHPKMDELKFVQDIMDDYNIDRSEALAIVRVARIKYCCK